MQFGDSKLNMSEKEFGFCFKEVSDLIYKLTLEGREEIDMYDIATYDALAQAVAKFVKETADTLQIEYEKKVKEYLKKGMMTE